MTRQFARVGDRTISYLDTAPPHAAAKRPSPLPDAAAGGERGAPPVPTLVLLHAFPLSADMWRPQLAAAPAGWRVVAPDLAGFGHTEDHEPAVSPDDYAADVLALLGELGVREAVIAGLSMGGYVAFGLYRLAPERFRALVLADTRADADSAAARESRRALLARLERGGPAAVADEMAPRLVGPTSREEQPDVEAHVRDRIRANAAAGIAHGIERMMGRADSTPLLARITCPTLIIVGEEDAVTPPEVARALHGGIPGSRLATIPRAGHLPNLEQPEAFNAALTGFLRGLDRR
jgi:3-oxoadipate enol-lactonase